MATECVIRRFCYVVLLYLLVQRRENLLQKYLKVVFSLVLKRPIFLYFEKHLKKGQINK